MNLSAPLHQALDKMGYTTATPIQALSIPPILDGKDLIALAPTGTGKTCAFGIPLVQQVDPQQPGIQAVVLCPTRELAMQTARELTLLAQYKPGVRVVSVYGGQPIERQIQHLRRKPQIIVEMCIRDRIKPCSIACSPIIQSFFLMPPVIWA